MQNLLDNRSKPEGGQWNYDSQNCKSAGSDIKIHTTYKNTSDDITKRVINLVEKTFAHNFGDI
ncbi:MAG: cryptochrome/photolyase family protein [Francisella endosymbiont of Hyalomma asiaticum]